MPGFVAVSNVEQLDWDFTGRKPDGSFYPEWPKSLANAKGTIREPSDKAIGDFLDGMKKLYGDVEALGIEGLDEDDPAAVLAAIDSVTGEDYVKLMTGVGQLYADLCSGSPSLDQIQALPLRIRLPFFTWLMSEVVRPEDGSSAGAQVVTLPGRAATG